jgi:kynurenine formamidase
MLDQHGKLTAEANPPLAPGKGVAMLMGFVRSAAAVLMLSAPVEIASAQGGANSLPTLEQVHSGQARVVDLTWTLNQQNAFWPGENYKPFELKTIATLEKDGVLSKAFSMPEHLGTHLDAPNHFEANRPSVDKISPRDLFAPGVMIDLSGPASMDADVRLTSQHIARWEREHGQIPPGAVVLLNTGWGRFWDNVPRYQNRDVQGRMHFPGYSAEAAEFLAQQRQVKGIGIDTLSIDYALSRDFAVHHIINRAGKYGLENVAGLDQLPPRGFWLIIAPIKIETGSGGPARIFAIVPE